ncbi:MAG: NAD(P)/FAD-dependent oxidoreductase [Candidatus Woesearchaeota archaeon]|nr:NAD(P)/FAD-dependent oxidoreductase [Candidatus Woesearchaeota archaeon]
MESFDVIIIGAGPAGLKCAETLGNSRFRVLLLEKNKEIGYKVCAGGLTGKDIECLNLPRNLIDFQYNKIKLHINNASSTVKYKNNFVYTIDRKNLGQWQLKKLKRFRNIEVRTNSRVSKIEKNFIIANDKKISYKLLVGADGSMSLVKKYLGIKSEDIDIAIQYVIATRKYKEFEVFFESKLFFAWYAWIFPHKNYVSVGCGCNPKILSSKELKSNFKNWLKKNKIDISKGKYEAFLLNYDYQGHRFKNVFLAGDAAGFVSGLTGEGIYPALISGEEIGKIILNPDYKSNKIADLLKIKKRHNQLMNFLIKCGKFRTMVFFAGMLLLKIPCFKKKAINLLA